MCAVHSTASQSQLWHMDVKFKCGVFSGSSHARAHMCVLIIHRSWEPHALFTYSNQNRIGEEGIYLVYTSLIHHNPPPMKSGQASKQKPRQESMGKAASWLAPMACSVCLLLQPRTTCPCPVVVQLMHQILIKKMTQRQGTGQSKGGNSSVQTPSSTTTLPCVQLTKPKQHGF